MPSERLCLGPGLFAHDEISLNFTVRQFEHIELFHVSGGVDKHRLFLVFDP
jgi:hypothetical protein